MKDLPKLLNGVQNEARGEFEWRYTEFDARQQRFDTAVKDLGAEVRAVEASFQRRLDALVEAATAAEIGSQLRASIADRVVEVLAGNGYVSAIDGGYEGSDQRCGFIAKAYHPDGSRIVVTVLPVEEGLRLTAGGPDPRVHGVPGLLAGQPGRLTSASGATPT